MSKLTKQEIQIAVREAMQQSQIPNEDQIRRIVREEIAGYQTKKEDDEKRTVLERLQSFFDNRPLYYIGIYVCIFFLILIDVCSYRFVSSLSFSLFKNIQNISFTSALSIIFIMLVAIVIIGIFIALTIRCVDIMLTKYPKATRVITIISLIYWCEAFFPGVTKFAEYLFNVL